jgi:hypothetical protein
MEVFNALILLENYFTTKVMLHVPHYPCENGQKKYENSAFYRILIALDALGNISPKFVTLQDIIRTSGKTPKCKPP